jgi:hypothetical protein
MENVFGHSFTGVRLHTDVVAERLAESFSARAFTIGNHISFGANQYRPGSLYGDAIIAHELAHVLQQRGPGATSVRAKDDTSAALLERDADNAATRAVAASLGNTSTIPAQAKGAAMPHLSSGLRLSRCSCSGDREPRSRERAPTPTVPVPAPPQPPPRDRDADRRAMATFLQTVILQDNQVVPGEWQQIRSRANELHLEGSDLRHVLGWDLNFVTSEDLFSELVMSDNPVIRRLAGRFSTGVAEGRRQLIADPLPLLLDEILQDSILTREELDALRSFYFALDLNETSFAAALHQRHIGANLQTWLQATMQLSLTPYRAMLSTPGLFPIQLQRAANGELEASRDLRPELVRSITADGEWHHLEFAVVRSLLVWMSRADATAFLQSAGIESTSADLLAGEFTRPAQQYRDQVLQRVGLHLHFQRNGAVWELTPGSRTDLGLPWHPALPAPLTPQGGATATGRGEMTTTDPNFRFSSGVTGPADLMTYSFRGHTFQIVLSSQLINDVTLLDRLDIALSHIPLHHIQLIRRLVCDPSNHPSGSAIADANLDGRVNLYFSGAGPQIPQANLNETTVHEFGHLVSFNAAAAAPDFWQTWTRAMTDDGLGVSRYGFTNEREDFAESYVAFLAGAASFRARYSHRAAILAPLVTPSRPPTP